jgi:hypothetical protein
MPRSFSLMTCKLPDHRCTECWGNPIHSFCRRAAEEHVYWSHLSFS